MCRFRATREQVDRIRDDLAERFVVDTDRGLVAWAPGAGPKNSRRSVDGMPGKFMKDGRRMVCVGGRLMQRARAIYFAATGHMPETIDHINGDCTDDRLSNLRASTPSLNSVNRGRQSNNTSGVPGLGWDQSRRGWVARVYGSSPMQRRFKDRGTAIRWLIDACADAYGESARSRIEALEAELANLKGAA